TNAFTAPHLQQSGSLFTFAGVVILQDLFGCQYTRVNGHVIDSTHQKTLQISRAETQRRCPRNCFDLPFWVIVKRTGRRWSRPMNTVLVDVDPRAFRPGVARIEARYDVNPFTSR